MDMGDPHPLLRGLLLCCLAGSALGLVEGRTFDIAMPESALGAYSVARPSLCKMETSVEECDRRDACFTCSNPCSCCTGCTRAAGCHCCNDHSVFHDTCPKATALSYCLWVNPEVDRGKLRSILLFKCGIRGGNGKHNVDQAAQHHVVFTHTASPRGQHFLRMVFR